MGVGFMVSTCVFKVHVYLHCTYLSRWTGPRNEVDACCTCMVVLLLCTQDIREPVEIFWASTAVHGHVILFLSKFLLHIYRYAFNTTEKHLHQGPVAKGV